MVVEEVVNVSSELIGGIGQIALWLQALGIVIILWIIFQAVSLYLNWKRWKSVGKIIGDMERIERKLDKAIKKL